MLLLYILQSVQEERYFPEGQKAWDVGFLHLNHCLTLMQHLEYDCIAHDGEREGGWERRREEGRKMGQEWREFEERGREREKEGWRREFEERGEGEREEERVSEEGRERRGG